MGLSKTISSSFAFNLNHFGKLVNTFFVIIFNFRLTDSVNYCRLAP
jgi:hypothetical protein